MPDVSVPAARLIVYGPPTTELFGVAKLLRLAEPVTSLVASVSPLTNPENVAVNVGLAEP